MNDWLGIGLIALGTGVFAAGIMKRRKRARTVLPPGAIRPEFAAMGEIVRPLLLFFIGLFGLKLSLFYFALGGKAMLTPVTYAGIMYLLATYGGYVVLVTSKSKQAVAEDPTAVEEPVAMRSAA